ncbi:STN domain-containing protein [Pseudomonas putida]
MKKCQHNVFAPTLWLVIRRSLRLAAPMAVGLAGLPAIAQAQQVQFNVPAQPLASALLAFGSQSNLQVLYSPQDVEGKRSSALTGAMEPAAALSRLLQGTGVSYQIQGNQVTIHTREGALRWNLGQPTSMVRVWGKPPRTPVPIPPAACRPRPNCH